MISAPRRARLRRTLAATATLAAVAATVGGAWMLDDGTASSGPPATAVANAFPHVASAAPQGSWAAGLPRSVPVRIVVPTVRIDAPLVSVGLDSRHHLQPPSLSRPAEAGWYAAGTAPGSPGTALVVGHVDDRTGPAVFFLLGKLRPGDAVDVVRRDGRTARFTVDAVALYPKNAFPSQEVYGQQPGPPQLRLLTCGGHYDPHTGYADNTVVYAHLTGE